MTAETLAGAPTHGEWHAINWRTVHHNVRRLQIRIVKATKEGRWNKVKALQRLLTHSFSGKALAVKRVTENQGKRTPGVDRIVLDSPEKKAQAIVNLTHHGYRPLPLKRILIPKANGKFRNLGIPTQLDRAFQALHLLALEPIAETTADPNSYGFRKGRSVADAIEQCFILLGRGPSHQWILEGDIKNCFDEISKKWLLDHIPMDKVILRKWLEAGYVFQQQRFPTESGTPQGSPISPVLANFTLDGLESELARRFPRRAGGPVYLVRYGDDFIITGKTKELLADQVKPLVTEFLRPRGLVLSETKTHLTHVAAGFDFLGTHIQKWGSKKLLTKPSRKNVTAFLRKIKAVLEASLNWPVERILLTLNPMIRGWANFHKASVSKAIFNYVDSRIFGYLEHWMKRRHPHKSRAWCYEKYLTRVNDRGFVFHGRFVDRYGVLQPIHLFQAADVKIQRHVKIRANANPFDPAWEPYFEARLGLQMANSLKDRRILLTLWFQQDGLCPVCHQKITKETGWNIHHLKRRVDGGTQALSNLTLLHPNCHKLVHDQGLSVSKPRPVKRAFRKA